MKKTKAKRSKSKAKEARRSSSKKSTARETILEGPGLADSAESVELSDPASADGAPTVVEVVVDGTTPAESGLPAKAESDGSLPEETASTANAEGDDLIPIIEVLVFASREPVTISRLVKTLGRVGKKRVEAAIESINEEYRKTGRPFELVEVAGGYQMMTSPEFSPWLARLIKSKGEERLSRSALETLAIVAYKQPITRAEIEAIRGVHAGQSLKMLLDKDLIKIAGRADILGRPMLYATTRQFLDHFGLKSVKDLPKRSELLAG